MSDRFYTLRGERLRLVALGGGIRRDPTGTRVHLPGTGLCADMSDGVEFWHSSGSQSPRSALLEREDGTRFVRPFRGLRRAT